MPFTQCIKWVDIRAILEVAEKKQNANTCAGNQTLTIQFIACHIHRISVAKLSNIQTEQELEGVPYFK
jgi:hypothetical protein